MVAANIVPQAGSDGLLYASAVPFTATEADLWGGTGAVSPDPIAVAYGAAVYATVQVTVNGIITSVNIYVVMQMDLGDGVWVDLNWFTTTINQGTATFVFSNGVAGANTVQQTRQTGAFPASASGSNQLTLAGRIRFVGRAVTAGGSSIAAGAAAIVTGTIRYKVLPLN